MRGTCTAMPRASSRTRPPRRHGSPGRRTTRCGRPFGWTTPDGALKTGEAPVADGSKAGSSTTVWLDDSGRLRPAPPIPAQARSQGAALGAATGAGVSVLVVGGWWAARVRLEVRRRSEWDRDWAEFNADRGPRHA
ncbi:Rv1733c family protein [Streptomyces sviceus]